MQSLPQGPHPFRGSGLNRVSAGPNDRPPERKKLHFNSSSQSKVCSSRQWSSKAATIAIAALLSVSTAALAMAQEAKIAPGDAVVTGFSGIAPSGDPPPPAGSPLDTFFIDLDGPSAQVLSLER